MDEQEYQKDTLETKKAVNEKGLLEVDDHFPGF